jgi:hypothetical protein
MQVGHRSIILYIKTLVLQFKALLVRRVLEELYRDKKTVRRSPKPKSIHTDTTFGRQRSAFGRSARCTAFAGGGPWANDVVFGQNTCPVIEAFQDNERLRPSARI